MRRYGIFDIPGIFDLVDLRKSIESGKQEIIKKARTLAEMNEEEQKRVIKFRQALAASLPKLLEIKEVSSDDPLKQPKRRPPSYYLPKKQKTRERWKEAYDIIVERRETYQEEFLDSSISKTPKGTIKDFQDALLRDMEWAMGERTVRNIIFVGDAGLLD